MSQLRVSSTAAVLALAASSLAAQSLLPQYGQVVAELGDSPTGLAPGEVFGTTSPFDNPLIDATGNVLVRGRLAAGGTVTTNNDRALFYGRTKAGLQMILRANDPEPSGLFPNSVIQQVSSGSGLPLGSNTMGFYRLAPQNGVIMVGAQLYDGNNPGLDGLIHTASAGTVNNTVLYVGTPPALQVLAQQNVTTMPGGAVLSSAMTGLSQQASALNSFGVVAFKSNLAGGDVTGTGNDSAWITGSVAGGLTYVIRESDPVFGGANAIGALGFNCAINESGVVLHDETLSLTLGTTPATANDDSVVLITIGGVHFQVMREGDVAPDTTGAPMPGIFYGSPTLAQGFSNTGKCAFRVILSGAVSAADDDALFVGDITSAQLVARAGDIVPGTGGEALDVINSSTSYTDAGGVLFGSSLVTPGVGGVTATNDSVLCFAKPGQPLQMIAREGDACPGLPGFVFGNLTGSSNFGSASSHKSNERGQAIFALSCNNGTDTVTVTYSYDPARGLEPQLVGSTTLGDVMGGGTVTLPNTPVQFPTGDGNCLGFNGNGEFVIKPSISGGNFVVRGAVGTAIDASTTVSLCPSPATLNVSGSPQIGDSFTIDLIGATGLGLTGYGFAPQIPLPTPCGCNIISDGTGLALGTFLFTPSLTLNVPYFAGFIGVQVQCQGIDLFPSSGGCSLSGIPFGVTDIWTVTIG